MVKENLSQTVKSVSSQALNGWNAVIAVNSGSQLPPLPPGFEVKWVDFPPNRLHEKGIADRNSFYDALRFDKGRRVLAGLLHMKPEGHVMIVDDDDFVSCNLTSLVQKNPEVPGWYFSEGYVWRDSGAMTYRCQDFHKVCGTSHIIRSDLYELPESFDQASEDYIKRMLGSHVFIEGHLRKKGIPLQPLPFPGAVYRIGHPGAHSKSKGLLRHFVANARALTDPILIARQLLGARPVTRRFRREFFGLG